MRIQGLQPGSIHRTVRGSRASAPAHSAKPCCNLEVVLPAANPQWVAGAAAELTNRNVCIFQASDRGRPSTGATAPSGNQDFDLRYEDNNRCPPQMDRS